MMDQLKRFLFWLYAESEPEYNEKKEYVTEWQVPFLLSVEQLNKPRNGRGAIPISKQRIAHWVSAEQQVKEIETQLRWAKSRISHEERMILNEEMR